MDFDSALRRELAEMELHIIRTIQEDMERYALNAMGIPQQRATEAPEPLTLERLRSAREQIEQIFGRIEVSPGLPPNCCMAIERTVTESSEEDIRDENGEMVATVRLDEGFEVHAVIMGDVPMPGTVMKLNGLYWVLRAIENTGSCRYRLNFGRRHIMMPERFAWTYGVGVVTPNASLLLTDSESRSEREPMSQAKIDRVFDVNGRKDQRALKEILEKARRHF